MKILYDHQIFSLQKHGGISRYFANLNQGINKCNEATSEIGILFTNNAYVDNKGLFSRAFDKRITDNSKRFKYNKWYCRYLVDRNNFDVFHPTFYNPYFLNKLKKPFVITVHDMINERFPQFYNTDPSAAHKKELINRAAHIIAISDFTKQDLLEFFNINTDKISVIHHGYQMQGNNQPANINPVNLTSINEKFLLYVGDRYAYKNFLFFVDAVASLIIHNDIILLCAGGKKFNNKELETFEKLGIIDKIVRLEVNDRQLNQLYRKALAFVYPSLYEGFGLPVLEAFKNNCPVILSHTTALPEVAGNAAEYFDPHDKGSIASAVKNVIDNPQKRSELKALGKERLKLFNFDNCLQKTLKVYSGL